MAISAAEAPNRRAPETQKGDDTPLGELETSSQTEALRFGKADVTAVSVGQIPINATTHVSDVAFVQVTPEHRDVFAQVNGQNVMYMVFGVALAIIILVLAAQFESVASAVVIMLTVPFGLAAALLAISLTGGSLNYYSQIRLVMLMG